MQFLSKLKSSLLKPSDATTLNDAAIPVTDNAVKFMATTAKHLLSLLLPLSPVLLGETSRAADDSLEDGMEAGFRETKSCSLIKNGRLSYSDLVCDVGSILVLRM